MNQKIADEYLEIFDHVRKGIRNGKSLLTLENEANEIYSIHLASLIKT